MNPSRNRTRPSAPAHVPPDVLAAVAGGGPVPAPWSAHARGCRACRSRLDAASTVAHARRAVGLEPVPSRAHARALGLFETLGPGRRAGLGERLAAFGRLILAGPVQATPALAYGVRGADAVTRCELTGGGWRVEIEWTPTGGRYALRGRVAPLPETPAPASLPRLSLEFEGGRRRRAPLSPRGFFGPVHGAAPRVRALLQTPRRSYRSAWVDGRAAAPSGDDA